MAKKYSELKKKLSADVIKASEHFYEKLKVVYSLGDLREILEIGQKDIQSVMKVSQPAISRLEKSEDMRLSTIRAYIEAAGGQLELHARFNEDDILIGNFSSKPKVRRYHRQRQETKKKPIRLMPRTA